VSDDDQADADELPEDLDVRSLSVIWGEDDDRPTVEYHGTSIYEAIGFAAVAFFRLLATEAHTPDLDDDDLEDE
jgi:hypothetical protein